MEPTWELLAESDRSAAWDVIYGRFAFRPDVKRFPGFAEPPDSVTFSLAKLYGDEEHYWRVRRACEEAALKCFRELIPASGWLNVLDWQHNCYRLRPHLPIEVDELGDWTVPFLPDGDYYLYLDPQWRFGTLGHPWEETLCVFGDELLRLLAPRLTELLGEPIRRGGRPTGASRATASAEPTSTRIELSASRPASSHNALRRRALFVVVSIVVACLVWMMLSERREQPFDVAELSQPVRSASPAEEVRGEPVRPTRVDPGAEFAATEQPTPHSQVAVASSGRIFGRLVDESGSPLARRKLLVASNRGGTDRYLSEFERHARNTYSDARGEFEFKELQLGEWIVGCSGERSEFDENWRAAPASFGKAVTLTESTPDARVELSLPCGLLIEGRVLDGEQLVEIDMHVVATALDGGHQLSALSEDGRFTLGPLLAGEYEVHAVGSALCAYLDSPKVRVPAGTRELVLTTTRGAALSIMAKSEGSVVTNETLHIVVSSPTSGVASLPKIVSSAKSPLTILGLPRERVDVVASAANGRIGVLRNVDVGGPSEAIREVVVELTQGATLEVENTTEWATVIWVRSAGSLVESRGVQPGELAEILVPVGSVRVECSDPRLKVVDAVGAARLDGRCRTRLVNDP